MQQKLETTQLPLAELTKVEKNIRATRFWDELFRDFPELRSERYLEKFPMPKNLGVAKELVA